MAGLRATCKIREETIARLTADKRALIDKTREIVKL
jgi:hypothetical protein